MATIDQPTGPPEELLSLAGVCKSFAGVPALRPTSLSVATGEILGLVGENGAGKSTLIRIVSGVLPPDGGVMAWAGHPVALASPRDALELGIATIHQELEYCGHLSVAENLLLGQPWPRTWSGRVDWPSLFSQAREHLRHSGFDLPVECEFSQLTAVQKQEAAIVTALSREARLLVLDEPTASLAGPESQRLLGHLRRLQSQGVAIIYVSHRLDEVLEISSRIAVLRDGELVSVTSAAEIDGEALVQNMIGRSLQQAFPRTRPKPTGQVLLSLQGLSKTGFFDDVSLTVHAGEIVGLAGLVGAGRSELARAIYGLYPPGSGTMQLLGDPWAPRSPWQALQAGLVYLPEERKRHGLVADHSLRETLTIGIRDRLAPRGLIARGRERQQVAEMIERYDIRGRGPGQWMGTLSGGNQQKALLGRWLEREPRVLVLDEPTRGVDVAAKADIHATIDRLAAGGHAVLLISSDLPEVVGMSDRVLVMSRGRLVAEVSGDEQTEQTVLRVAAGLGEHP